MNTPDEQDSLFPMTPGAARPAGQAASHAGEQPATGASGPEAEQAEELPLPEPEFDPEFDPGFDAAPPPEDAPPAGYEELVALMNEATSQDRKSTRLNSSHVSSSYAVFCLKKKSADVE